jgi:hypothetical protein
MEKQLSNVGYWLGLFCTVVALILRGLGALHIYPTTIVSASEHAISYTSFLRGAILFFLLAIASWCRTAKS